MLMGTIVFLNIKYNNIDYEIENDIGFRSLFVYANGEELDKHYNDKDYDYGFDKILKIDHVVEMYDSEYSGYSVVTQDFKDKTHDGYLLLAYGSNNTLPKVIEGKKFKEDDTGVAICPINFYPSLIGESLSIKEEDYIDGRDYINKIFKIKVDEKAQDNGKFYNTGKTYEKEYKIIGVYNNKNNDAEPNTCYISPRDIKELYDSTLKKANENNIRPKLVIIDKSKNTKLVMEKLYEMGFDPAVITFFDYNEIKKISMICISIASITFGVIIIVILLYLKKLTNDESRRYGLLKSVGYNNNDMKKIILYHLLIQIMISYIVSVVLIIIIIYFIKNIFAGYLLYNNYSLNHSIAIYLIGLSMLIIISALTCNVYTSHKLKNQSNYLLKGEAQ